MATAKRTAAKKAVKEPAAKRATAKKTSTKTTTAKASPAKGASTAGGFTAAERAAMRERAREVAADAKRKGARDDGEADLLAKVAAMPEPDRTMATRVHELVMIAVPDAEPRTWYGMPAYARDGKVVCFVQVASKFQARYTTLGFNDAARLDDGSMWPTAFALTRLDRANEARIRALVATAFA